MKQKENLFLFQQSGILSLKKKLDEYKQKKKQLQAEKDALYERYALAEISVAEYQMKAAELTEKLTSLSVSEEEVLVKLDRLEREYQKAEEDMKQRLSFVYEFELEQ